LIASSGRSKGRGGGAAGSQARGTRETRERTEGNGLLLAWEGLRHLADPDAGGLFAGITFGVHELGHFAVLGEFFAVLGGSLNQILIPIAAGALLYHHGDYFGIAGAGAWLASSLMNLARYIGDARSFDLDFLSFGEAGQHDWAWLLGRFGLLPYDARIAAVTRGAGVLILAGSISFGVWLCIKMRQATRAPG
jgi:hypothetical protein